MTIIVVGGSGLVGSKLINSLPANGQAVTPAFPTTGVDTITGEGFGETFAGADVLVDVSNSPSLEDDSVLDFFGTPGRNLMPAEFRCDAHVVRTRR